MHYAGRTTKGKAVSALQGRTPGGGALARDHVPVRAQVADICLGGCYVEMSFTKNVTAEVDLTLWVGDQKISATGIVVSSHPSFGNGIKFTHVAPDSKEKLKTFVDGLKPKITGPR